MKYIQANTPQQSVSAKVAGQEVQGDQTKCRHILKINVLIAKCTFSLYTN